MSSVTVVATEFNIPRLTLLHHLASHLNRAEIRANSHKLSEIEEQSLLKWGNLWIREVHPPPTPRGAVSCARYGQFAACRTGFNPPPTVGSKSIYDFIQRSPEIKTRPSRRYDYQRAQNEDISQIRRWFTLVSEIIAKYGILTKDIYNFDETGFAMDVIAATKVVTRSDYYGEGKTIATWQS